MNRRSFLSIVGAAAFSGCQSVRPFPFADIPPRKLDRVRVEPLTEQCDLSVSASILQEKITPESLARVELTVRWDGTKPIRFDEVPKTANYNFGDPSVLWLVAAEHETSRKNDRTWVPDKGSRAFQGGLRVFKYDPGESKSREYELWADPYGAAWIRPGEYQTADSVIWMEIKIVSDNV